MKTDIFSLRKQSCLTAPNVTDSYLIDLWREYAPTVVTNKHVETSVKLVEISLNRPSLSNPTAPSVVLHQS